MIIQISFDDSIKDRILTAMCAKHGYQANINDGNGGTMPNPVTPDVFVANILSSELKDAVITHEAQAAHDAAQVKANTEIVFS